MWIEVELEQSSGQWNEFNVGYNKIKIKKEHTGWGIYRSEEKT